MVMRRAAFLSVLLMLFGVLVGTLLLVRSGIHDYGGWIGAKTDRELRGVATAIRVYHEKYGKILNGDTQTIIAILGGQDRNSQNPDHIIFWEINKRNVNRHGDWVDQWGKPIQFIYLGTTNMLLRSFGENRREDGGTNDDITVSVFK